MKARETVPLMGEQDTRPFYRYIQDNIGVLWGPGGRHIGVRAVLGAWCPLAKIQVIDQWKQALPQLAGHVSIHPGVSHFVDEMRPVEIAEAIMDVSGLLGAGS